MLFCDRQANWAGRVIRCTSGEWPTGDGESGPGARRSTCAQIAGADESVHAMARSVPAAPPGPSRRHCALDLHLSRQAVRVAHVIRADRRARRTTASQLLYGTGAGSGVAAARRPEARMVASLRRGRTARRIHELVSRVTSDRFVAPAPARRPMGARDPVSPWEAPDCYPRAAAGAMPASGWWRGDAGARPGCRSRARRLAGNCQVVRGRHRRGDLRYRRRRRA